jgi:hypothetical protein
MNLKRLIIPGLVLIGIVILLIMFANHKFSNESTMSKTPKITVQANIKYSDDTVIAYLEKNVPEIETFQRQIDKLSDGQVKLIMRFDEVPGKNSTELYHDYYVIYVGEDHPDHTVRWNTFYVKGDLSKILVENIVSGDIVTLDQWRKTNN